MENSAINKLISLYRYTVVTLISQCDIHLSNIGWTCWFPLIYNSRDLRMFHLGRDCYCTGNTFPRVPPNDKIGDVISSYYLHATLGRPVYNLVHSRIFPRAGFLIFTQKLRLVRVCHFNIWFRKDAGWRVIIYM